MQYSCGDYTKLREAHGITASMSRSDNPYDNDKAESFVTTLKPDEVDGKLYRNLKDAERYIGTFIEEVYKAAPAFGAGPSAIGRVRSLASGLSGVGRARRCASGRLRAAARPRSSLTSRPSGPNNHQPAVRFFGCSLEIP